MSAHCLTFLHRFLGPAPAAAEEHERPPQPIETRYWAPPYDTVLSRNRFAVRHHDRVLRWAVPERRAWLRCAVSDGGALAVVEAGPGCWLWLAWVSLADLACEDVCDAHAASAAVAPDCDRCRTAPADFATVQRFQAVAHEWAPSYPGHALPVLEVGSGPATIAEVLGQALPPSVSGLSSHFDDAVFDSRLATWALIHVPTLPSGEALRALVDVDPPTGMEAPDGWADAWLADRVYRRWQRAGVLYGFSHHSGVVLHRDAPWLQRLCRPRFPVDGPGADGAYFDMALLVLAESAVRVLVRSGRAEHALLGASRLPVQRLEAWLGAMQAGFTTPLDQGRALLRLWRTVAMRDLACARCEEVV